MTAVLTVPEHVSLGCRLAAAEVRAFQGRAAELRHAWRLLCSADLLPHVLRVHGPPGIGKTAFVSALARLCGDRGYPAVIIDSRELGEPAVVREVIAERTAAALAATDGKPMVLTLDAMEEMRDLRRPLWDDLLPGLHENVLVVLSGRTPARCLDPPGGWHGLVDDLELGGLSQAQARRLLRQHRVFDPSVVNSIALFAGGNPLFLTVAAHQARSANRWDATQAAAVARSLIGRLTSEIVDPVRREMLEAVSLVHTFNQELLVAMLDTSIQASAYRELCGLSIVREVPHGARLHDQVREAVAADLRWRSPAAYHAMRQRARRFLARQAATAPDDDAHEQELLQLGAGSAPLADCYVAAGDDAGPYAQQVPEHELADQVKVALGSIHWLDRLEENPLTGLTQVRHEPSPAMALRGCLLQVLRDLEAAPALADRQAGALLTDYYLNQVGSLELVADKLGLPRTTFYRRLHRGLTRVAQRLRADELTMALRRHGPREWSNENADLAGSQDAGDGSPAP